MSPADVFAPETDDRSFARDQMVRDWLRKPFKPEQVGKLPATARRPALDYVGHAAVTDRLNRIAPDWTYTVDESFSFGDAFWVRGTMTVGGVSRVEFGDGDDPKDAIGNFIRRAAMRFGVAIDLWSREELEPSGAGRAAGGPETLPAPDAPSRGQQGSNAHAHGEGATAASSAAPSATRIFPKNPKDCKHRAVLVDYEGEKVCSGCGLVDALIGASA
jgi:hypothetical protein